MKKEQLIEERRKYVKSRVEGVRNKGTEVQRIARELFLSKCTIYNDLKK